MFIVIMKNWVPNFAIALVSWQLQSCFPLYRKLKSAVVDKMACLPHRKYVIAAHPISVTDL